MKNLISPYDKPQQYQFDNHRYDDKDIDLNYFAQHILIFVLIAHFLFCFLPSYVQIFFIAILIFLSLLLIHLIIIVFIMEVLLMMYFLLIYDRFILLKVFIFISYCVVIKDFHLFLQDGNFYQVLYLTQLSLKVEVPTCIILFQLKNLMEQYYFRQQVPKQY